MVQNEVANVSRCCVPNLRRFWTVKLPFVTLWPVTRVKSSSHAEFYRTLLSTTSPFLRYDLNYCLHVRYIMSKNNLGYETCRIMFIKMTAKSKFSPRSSKNGAIGLNTLYSFSSSALNYLRAKLAI